MKKTTKPKRLLLQTEKVRDLKPIEDEKLGEVAGGLGPSISGCSFTRYTPSCGSLF